jgi:nicotinamide-nucleotide amidase
MAEGALTLSHADLSVAITGYAGPGEGEEGLVFMAAARRDQTSSANWHREKHYGTLGRANIRARAAADAISLMRALIADGSGEQPR